MHSGRAVRVDHAHALGRTLGALEVGGAHTHEEVALLALEAVGIDAGRGHARGGDRRV